MSDDVTIRLGLKGQQETSRGLKKVADDERSVGAAAALAGRSAGAMGASFNVATRNIGAGLAQVRTGMKWGAAGLLGLTAAGAKWGLSFNAQVESARLRFKLFTDDVDGLTRSVQKIDMTSAFTFGDLSDAAALLGNSGVKDIPNVLQASANAAAASGRGLPALQSIVIALSQIQSKGKLSQEGINQLNEAGAPGAQRIIAKGFGLTAKQLQNLGGQGLDATKAIQLLTSEWTSGRMAKAAEDQTKTLGGQWALATGNLQKLSGAATSGLAKGLERDVLPAANRAIEQITRIMGQDGLSNPEKLRRSREVIRQQLGPVARDLIQQFDDADVAGHLESAFEGAMSRMATVVADQAPHVVKAFVDAWLGAGPWAKLLSGAWLVRKLGIDKGLLTLAKGGKGGAAGAAGTLGGRGQTPMNPLYVWQVGDGVASVLGGKRGGGKEPVPGGLLGRAARRAAPVVGAVSVGGAAYGAYLEGLNKLNVAQGYKHDAPVPPHIPNARYSQKDLQSAGVIGPTLPPLTVQSTVNIDGRKAAQSLDIAKARRKARTR